ncbi:hypothetical protein CBER1_06944 [Cercospora berteroae]|uniref:Nucleoprotein TPR/MLP1 domain-containing protein n=1 Tax=Cercospora berteroae TaxID=357750 RepID=A0A2S6C403_9PEZI|nr:hypothetical protein CBER1_06944 [Cercospora berteroae]
MANIVAFPLSCLASILTGCWLDKQHSNISNTTISAPSPLPSPAEGALFADITAPSVDNIESFPTMDLPVHALEVASSSLEASSSSYPFALVAALASLISCFLYFGYLFSDSDPTGAIQYGEYLLEASINDQEHGQQAAREALLDTDQAKDKHQLSRPDLTVDSLKKAVSKAKNSEADAKAAAEKSRSDLRSVQAQFDHLKVKLDASTADRDEAHSRVSEMTGKNEKLVEAQQALRKEMDSRRDEFDVERQELTRKAGEAAQASEAELASVNAMNARLTDANVALENNKVALVERAEHFEREWTSAEDLLDQNQKILASERKSATKRKQELDAALGQRDSHWKTLQETKSALRAEKSATTKVQEKLDTAQSELSSFQTQLSEVQGSNETLKKQSEADRVKLKEAQSGHQNLQERLKTVQKDLDSVQKDSSVLQETNGRLKLEIANLQKQALDAKEGALRTEEKLNNDCFETLRQFMDAENERDSACKKLEELRSSAQQDKDQLNLLQNEVEQLTKKLDDSENLRKDDGTRLKKVQNELFAAREAIADAGDTSEVAQEYSSLKKKYKDLKGKLKTEENASHQLRNELSRDRAALEVERQRADELDAEKSGFLTKQHSSAETLLQKDRDLTSSQKSVNKLRGELEDAQNAKRPAETGWFNASRRVKELEAENAKLRDDSKMQRALDDKEEALQKANSAVQQHREGLAHRNKKISDLNKELEEAKKHAMSPSQLQQYCEQAQQEAIIKEHKNGLHHYGKLEREHRAKLAELAEAAAEQQSALDEATFAAEQIAIKLHTLCLMLKYSKLWLDRWRNGRSSTNQDDAGDDDQKPEDHGGDQDGQDDEESKKNNDDDAGGPDGEAKDDGAYDDSQPDGGEDEDAPGEDEDEYDYSGSYGEDVESVNATDNTVEPSVTPNETTTGTNGPISLADNLPTLADNDTATEIDELIIPKWLYGNKRGGRGNATEQKKGQKKRRKHNNDTESSTLNSDADLDSSAATVVPESPNTLTQASQQAFGQSSSVSSPSTSSAPSMSRQAQNQAFRPTNTNTREAPCQLQDQALHQLGNQAPQQLQYQAPYQPQYWAPHQLPYQSPHQPQYQTYHQAQDQAPLQAQNRSPNHMSTSVQPPRQPYGFSGPSNWASQSRYSTPRPAQRRRY